MSYSADLLQQATSLCRADPRRPRQANLRRAVSSAYYGLFHELCGTAAALLLPARRSDLQVRLRRKFVHRTMKAVALSATVSGNAGLATVADTFVGLQEARHRADYGFSRPISRFETESAIARAARAFEMWSLLRDTPDGEQFAVELLLGKLDA